MKTHYQCACALVLVCAAACGNKEVVQSEPPASSAQDAAARKAAEEQAVSERQKPLVQAYATFTATRSGSAETRRAAYRALVEAYDKAKPIPDPKIYSGVPSSQADAFLKRLDALAAEAEADGKDTVPEEPKHEPPKFDGAFPLGGAVRKCYKDGVALESNGKFYFVRDAKCPDLALLQGYVEDTGSTVNLDIGRDGREAAVVTISDAEKASDDRAAHRRAVAEYEANYAREMAEYRTAVREKGSAAKAAKARLEARATERASIEGGLDRILNSLALGKAPSAASTNINLNDLPDVEPVKSAKGRASAGRGTAAARPVPVQGQPVNDDAYGAGPAPTAAPPAKKGNCGCAPGDLVCAMKCKDH